MQLKTAEVRFNPKPGKSPHIDNLKLISLTSCIGKVLERIILKRLQQHLEHLSTQDVLLQLKEEIIAPATRHSPLAILAVDCKRAFDNVTHAASLGWLNQTGCGKRTCRHIADFLRYRQAILKLGVLTSGPNQLGSRGAPRGSLVSPLLFNIAFIGLPAALERIPNLRHGLYAYGITLWTGTDSPGGIQETLQRCCGHSERVCPIQWPPLFT